MKKRKILSAVLSATVGLSMMLGNFGNARNSFPGFDAKAISLGITFKNPTATGEVGYIRVKPYDYSDTMYALEGSLEYRAVDVDLDGKYDCIEIEKGADTLTDISIPAKLTKLPAPKEPNRANIEFDNPEIPEKDEAKYESYDAYIDTLYDKAMADYEKRLTAINSTTNMLDVKLIGEKAFSECNALSQVTIPSSVAWIGADAFEGTPWLEDMRTAALAKTDKSKGMVIVNNILLDGRRCEGLMADSGTYDLKIPDTVVSIADRAFYGNNNIETNGEYDDEGEYFVGYLTYKDGTGEQEGEQVPVHNSLPAFTVPQYVKSVGNEAFCGCSSISNVAFSKNIRSIGNRAFADCSSLELVNDKNVENLAALGYQAFTNTPWLDKINENDSDSDYSIDYKEFGDTGILLDGSNAGGDVIIWSKSQLPFAPNIVLISPYAFMENAAISTITIPDTVQIIGDHAFEDCSGLTDFKLSAAGSFKAIQVGVAAFKNCSSLENADLPLGVTVPDELFSGCSSLTKFSIPTNAEKIGREAFLDCNSLSTVSIPQTVKSIGIGAFDNTAWIEEQRKKSANGMVVVKTKTLNLLLDGKGASGEVTTPSGVTEIQGYAFQDNLSLTDISIGSSVKKIGVGAFDGCVSLETVTIYNNSIEIEPDAFNDFGGTIYCNKNSAAHTYAKDNDLSYEFITKPAVTTAVTTTKTTTTKATTTAKTTSKTTTKTTTKTTSKTTATNKVTSNAVTTTSRTTAKAVTDTITTKGTTTMPVTTSKSTTVSVTESHRVTDEAEEPVVSTTVGTTTSKVVTPKATTTSKVVTPKATTTSKVVTPRATTTSNVVTPKATTTSKVVTPKATTTSKVVTPKATTTSNVVTPKATTTSKVVTPRATTTSNVITPRVTTTSIVTTKKAVTTKASITRWAIPTSASTTKVTTTTSKVTTPVTTAPKTDRVQIVGDANNDGKLNVRDAAYIAKKLAAQRATELGRNSDFNGDGKINVRDAAGIAKYLAITSRKDQ